MIVQLNKLILAAFIINSLVSCAKHDRNKNLQDKPTNTVAKYDTQSCKYDVLEGDQADFTLSDTNDFTASYFEKEYNKAHLAAILSTNVSNTIEFINKTGVTVYKSSPIASQICQRPLFAQASELPSDLEKIWKMANGDHKEKDSLILGLYLPQDFDNTSTSLKKSAAIIIRENTNRWTLVHEFMHHLFSQRAIQLGYKQNEEKSKLESAIYNMQRIAKDPSKSEAEKYFQLVSPFIAYAHGIDSQMIQFSLEEITIEATLKNLQNQGLLKYAPAGSNWYISVSAEKALENYKKVEDLGYSLYLELPHTAIKERESIMNVLSMVSKRTQAIENIQRQFPTEDYSFYTTHGVMPDSEGLHHEGCAHEEEAKRISDLTEQVQEDLSFLRHKHNTRK